MHSSVSCRMPLAAPGSPFFSDPAIVFAYTGRRDAFIHSLAVAPRSDVMKFEDLDVM